MKANIRFELCAYLLFCGTYDICLYLVTPVKYKAFLCRSLTSSSTILNYLNALRHVNLHMGFDVTFMNDFDGKMKK